MEKLAYVKNQGIEVMYKKNNTITVSLRTQAQLPTKKIIYAGVKQSPSSPKIFLAGRQVLC